MSKMSAVKLFHSVLLGIGRFFLWGVRWIKRAFYALVFAVAVLAAAVFFSDEIIKYAINNSTKYVDLNAGVEDVDVHLFTQRIVLKNLRIKNPDGFPEKDAFFASKIAFKFDLSERKNPLKRIYVQNAKVCIEGRTGRRIMAKSFLKSNVYVIAREIGRVFDIKLEKIIFGPPPDEKKAAPEKNPSTMPNCASVWENSRNSTKCALKISRWKTAGTHIRSVPLFLIRMSCLQAISVALFSA